MAKKSGGRRDGLPFSIKVVKLFVVLAIMLSGWGLYLLSVTGHSGRIDRFFRETVSATVRRVRDGVPRPSAVPESPAPAASPASAEAAAAPDVSSDEHLRYGVPGPCDKIVNRTGYAIGYQKFHKQPSWASYHLTADMVAARAAKRSNRFLEDPTVPGGSARLADYNRSGYDRGHLVPAADMAYSVRTMNESFLMSNMSPQKPRFNRGVWKDLEAQVRDFARTEKDIYVVTGPVLPASPSVTIGDGRVTVPQQFYKVVYDATPPEKMIGFVLPNEGSDRSPRDFAVSVDAVEKITGLDFFPSMPKDRQDGLESKADVGAWRWLK